VTAADLVRSAFEADVTALQDVDPQLRGVPSSADVHAARVSLRRLRGHLRTFAPLLDSDWAAALNERLRWLGDGLSAARDADVLLEGVNDTAAALSGVAPEWVTEALEPIRARRHAAYERLAEALHDPRYAALHEALSAAAREPPLTPAAQAPAAALVGILMKPAWRRVRRAVRRAGRTPTDGDLHRIRIKAKYLRYAAEAMVPVAGRRAKRFARRVETLQAQLGKQHDAVCAAAVLRELQGAPNAAVLDAELAARETATARKLRRRWRTCWARIDDAEARFW
jgi:CHAD domain-containing protein